jgi:glycosyltransferase involved in cell wall biosynthesis
LESILNQTVSVNEIIVIDDASIETCPKNITDISSKIKVIRNTENRGRGYCRNLGVQNSVGKYIMMVDATNCVEERFIEKSLRHFNDKSVIAVSGTLRSTECNTTLSRWRARHLFKEQSIGSKKVRSHMLITYGTLFSRDALKTAGGFNPNLRYKEDEDVGNRLKKNNLHVIGDPNISIFPSKTNSLYELLERYCRWNMDIYEKPTFFGYLLNIKASVKPMMQIDLKEGDVKSLFISILVPHFQLFFSVKTFLNNKR